VNESQMSIVITTRDRPAVLEDAVESALGQTVEELEVIVIDDGSIVPVALRSTDPRLRCVRQEVPLGLSAARNVGLELARSPWVTFLDDDDRLLPNMVELSLAAARSSSLPPPVAVISAVDVVDESGRTLETTTPSPMPKGQDYLAASPPKYKNSLVAPVDVLRSIGGWDPAITSWEHVDLLLRLNARCSIEGIDEVTYRRTEHPRARLTTNHLACAEGIGRTLDKHRSQFEGHRRLHAWYLAEMSKHYLKAGRWLPAVRAATRSLARNPGRRHAVRQWVGTLLGPGVKSWYLRRREARSELGAEARSEGSAT
jgi:glycosyltransferase involved in cell wall biosynthesis